MDVQGALDALLRNMLLERMRRQSWPRELLMLVRSFLADRRAFKTGFMEVRCGTRRGLPLSPVPYLTELFAPDTQLRFGYGDDIRKVLDGEAVN